jgi:LPXTG-motif cell wall-anchored protein
MTTPIRIAKVNTADTASHGQVLMPVTGGDSGSGIGVWIGIASIAAAAIATWRRYNNGK